MMNLETFVDVGNLTSQNLFSLNLLDDVISLLPSHNTMTSLSSPLTPMTSASSYPSETSYATQGTTKTVSCQSSYSYDVSKIPYPRIPTQYPLWELVLKSVVSGLILLIAFFGNVLIIVIVSLSKKMRTTINFYIVNLAVADLLIACFPLWIHVTTYVTGGWILGGILCKLNAFVQISAMCAMSFTMMAIAGDRFFAIVFPLKARVTQRKVRLVTAMVWVCAVSIGVPPLLFYTYTERQWSNYRETFCHDVWPVMVLSDGSCDNGILAERIFWAVVIAALNWIPMLIMTLIYTVIIHRLRFSRMTNNNHIGISAVQSRSARKVIKMLFILLVTFMACTVPFQVVTIYENYKDRRAKLSSWYQPVLFTSTILMYAHSAINPIMYGAMNKTFRTGFRHLLGRIRGEKTYGWDSQINMAESLRAKTAPAGQGRLDNTNVTSVSELVHTASVLSTVVLPKH
ncbi:trissin receptor-like [Physella acuta]|uniref:trissin receptor-like n=1 Tax=Physella acuta TaxID=109671 RepID=UPI0027DD4B21|nr:trissin receptor-like [Physella acuta]